MSIHRCPDCAPRTDPSCKTCGGTCYVHRNSYGRITHSASAKEMLTQLQTHKPGWRPSPQGYRRRR